ncbi:DUF2269 domain-containing protein [Microbulbifer variabilis]|uniref:DUF2269 domain-containing protein n=1 Tax=Microbulbifer variabilis TaxID=266805 RepID=A0ABY4V6X5_9GAMM|nr:DUF2269 domain-containing protein [Microbulbifer variabilis]USD20024.1 DUF2269 domain-containing protein [Microbulbifer variabilis]
MNYYLALKTLHILCAIIVLGTGTGIAWYTLRGWLSGDSQVIQWVSKETVRADWIFTGSAVLGLLGSALGMLVINPAWIEQTWLQLAAGLTLAVFLLWLPVVYLQYQLRAHANQENSHSQIRWIMRTWCLLGALAFPLTIAIVYLMVSKPSF